MRRVIVQFTLMNNQDLVAVELGHLRPDQIRQVSIQGVVDTGAARLVLPESVVKHLGLTVYSQAVVRYADHRRETRDMVNNAFVQLCGRGSVFNAIVEPGRSDALLGAIVMEDLDLIVDYGKQRVEPRDPQFILAEIE